MDIIQGILLFYHGYYEDEFFISRIWCLLLIVYFIDQNVVYIFNSVQSKLKFKTTT